MKIQVINYSKEEVHGDIVYRKLAMPDSLDEFEFNIIDITDEKIWYNNTAKTTTINCINDFISVRKMVSDRKTSTVIYVLPQDVMFNYSDHTRFVNGKSEYVYKNIRIKDNLNGLRNEILPSIIPMVKPIFPEVVFENTRTVVGGREYHAMFHIKIPPIYKVITQSIGSEKTTTFMYQDNIYITTLDITNSTENIIHYVNTLFFAQTEQVRPDWISSIEFNDDMEQRTRIEKQQCIIREANKQIEDARGILDKNERYKSILYTQGDELVSVVFDILEQVLECDLSQFVDKKKEDFLIKKVGYTFIGEIKGINSNARNENLAQLENHYQKYMDRLQDEGKTETVYQILIINPMRNTPLEERKPINEDQIKLAERYGSLIIESNTLLRLYEKFLQGTITTEKLEETLIRKKGLLSLKDFDEVIP